jgi:DNA invertase Pin-like site-specific DNA recombinase
MGEVRKALPAASKNEVHVDTSGPMGRFFVTIISAIAELERSLVAGGGAGV